MYTNGINSYGKVREDSSKSQMTGQNFDFDGEAFSDLMDEKPAGKGLRETAQELAEDDAVLSTDEENRAMIKKPVKSEQTPKPHFAMEEDKARLLKLMDMSNKINMSSINITKSKKELENTVGPSIEDNSEPEDITKVIAKMMSSKDDTNTDVENDDVETSISMDKHTEDFEEENKKNNSQILYETEEELLEDMSILSTEEENLEMARRNAAMNKLSDDDYKTTQDDMMFLNEIVALNNQIHVEQSDRISIAQNVMNALVSQTKTIDNSNRMDMSELSSNDVDFIIGLLRMGTADSSNYTDENNDELHILSEKFLALLRDSIINKKVFRIDFDNDISVIIKIDVDGKVNAEFLTGDEAVETYLKNHLHILKEKFEELNVNYGDITYRNTTK
ncbi:MAG: hypothetical protein LUB59_00150 [Candidatus Gastranaerophilales bacterium]|nr:hypothetical protein [Candidatus Gastranaerophilales bacterium]